MVFHQYPQYFLKNTNNTSILIATINNIVNIFEFHCFFIDMIQFDVICVFINYKFTIF